MSKRTKEEIAAEIAAVEALQPPHGKFRAKQLEAIELMVSALKGEIDETCQEFCEMCEEDIDTYMQTRAWVDGQSENKPSDSWKGTW